MVICTSSLVFSVYCMSKGHVASSDVDPPIVKWLRKRIQGCPDHSTGNNITHDSEYDVTLAIALRMIFSIDHLSI